MNGEVGLVCRLTAAARKAIKNREYTFAKLPYENDIAFEFCSKFLPTGAVKAYTAADPEAWFEKLRAEKATEVFMIIPYDIPDRRRLGFVNTSGATIFVKYKVGLVSRFMPQWTFDEPNKRWNGVLRESVMHNAPDSLPAFQDNTEQFGAVLTNLAKFSEHLGFGVFTECFKKGCEVLNGGDIPEGIDKNTLPKLSDNALRLYLAADISDVFGAMGSWNDGPAAKAKELGLMQDYDKLSAALLAQNRLALMYAINMC